jgi:hypothetical protein
MCQSYDKSDSDHWWIGSIVPDLLKYFKCRRNWLPGAADLDLTIRSKRVYKADYEARHGALA